MHQDDELWEPWSAAFVEWFVVERVERTSSGDRGLPPAAQTYRELPAGDPKRDDVEEIRRAGESALALLNSWADAPAGEKLT